MDIKHHHISDLNMIPGRDPDSNKGNYGHVLVIAGSKGMSGAAYLAALAAYRTGAGLVRILTIEENRVILLQQLPEAIVNTYTASEILGKSETWTDKLGKLLAWASFIVLGPGLGRAEYVRNLVQEVLESAYVPVIIDADGLNTIAQVPYLTSYYTENIIITPHVGEMARLCSKTTDEINGDLIGNACNYRDKNGVTCLLKSSHSIIATKDGEIYETLSGCSALAKAGSGDVLTGIIAGLLCLGLDEGHAASLGSFIHGLCGRAAAAVYGEHGVLARDIVQAIPDIMKQK